MKQFIISIALVVGMIGMAHAYDKDSYSVYEMSASSAQVFTGAGYIVAVALSTPGANYTYGDSWGIVYDSVTIANASYTSMARANKIMFEQIYVATPTVSNRENGLMTFPSPGIFCANGAFAVKSAASSGGALRMSIYYRK
jgi:hypothetical protein